MDISNGPGVRVSIFMQGCPFHCKNCFNPETHDFSGGLEFNDEAIAHVLELADKDYVVGLSILGGEPMHPENVGGTLKLAKAFKEKYPNKNVWVWTGYLYEEVKDSPVLEYVDVLVDGKFEEELYSPLLKWRGSSNQRVIDIKSTLNQGKIIEFAH